MLPRIAIIGAGNVGGTAAHIISTRELCDVVLVESPEREGVARGKALDISQACALALKDVTVHGTSDFSKITGVDMCVITAGVPRQPGMTREDLLESNISTMHTIAENIKRYAPDSIVVVVSNPVDTLSYFAQQFTGFKHSKVIGMAGVLDSARLRCFIASAAGCSYKDVQALVLGSHGDTMVPVMNYCTIDGVPVCQILKQENIKQIVARTRDGGGELVKLLGISAFYAAGTSIADLVECVLYNQKRMLPCCVSPQGAYGLDDLYIGLPIILGSQGVEKIVPIKLAEDEMHMLAESASAIKQTIDAAQKFVTLQYLSVK